MNLKYQNRWYFVCQKCNRINELIDSGHIIFNKYDYKDDEYILKKFTITDKEIYIQDGNSQFQWFECDLQMHHGLHTQIKELRKEFENMRVVKIMKNIKI